MPAPLNTDVLPAANPDAGTPYEFRHEIARGGMGSILEAADCKLGRTVAVKITLSEMEADAGQKQRFINEAAVLAQLAHPNIVPVYDIGRDSEGQLYYSMKLVRGRTLQAIINGLRDDDAETVKQFTLPHLLTVFRKVCDALAFAHSRQIIHRDLKPENIMVGEFGEVLVMDWGLAKRLNDEIRIPNAESGAAVSEPLIGSQILDVNNQETIASSASATMRRDALRRLAAGTELDMTLEGDVMGTPQYMSPEQAEGRIAEMVDVRSDIFSLGGILYAILTLRPPIEGKTLDEVLQKVISGSITSLSSSTTGQARRLPANNNTAGGAPALQRIIPPALAAVTMKALTADKAKRYQDVAAFRADIEAYQNGFATSAENAGAWKQFTLLIKRNKTAAIGVAAVLIVGGVLGTKAILEGKRAERGEVLAKTEAKRANAALADLKASAPSLLALAESEAAFQRFDSALVKLDAAVALDPALSAGWWQRAWLLLGMERYGEAAAAFRTAQQHDPAQHAHDALLPMLDAIAAAPDDATRFPPERTDALFRHFTKVGASGELNALSRRLTLGAKQKEQMVRQRLDEWLGKNVGIVEVQPDGTIKVFNLPKATDTLEPLRGLPIAELSASHSDISDLTPLTGMPLRKFSGAKNKITDLSPLRGAPLEGINLDGNRIVDFSALRGAPLKSVDIQRNQCSVSATSAPTFPASPTHPPWKF